VLSNAPLGSCGSSICSSMAAASAVSITQSIQCQAALSLSGQSLTITLLRQIPCSRASACHHLTIPDHTECLLTSTTSKQQ
jgi:hypothetical protein